jgi:hypothetical protein
MRPAGPAGQVAEEAGEVVDEHRVGGALDHLQDAREAVLVQDGLLVCLVAQQVAERAGTALAGPVVVDLGQPGKVISFMLSVEALDSREVPC